MYFDHISNFDETSMLTSTQPQARTRTIPGGNSQVAGTIAQLRRQAGTSEASAAFVLSLINVRTIMGP
jgi:hypothetical protein